MSERCIRTTARAVASILLSAGLLAGGGQALATEQAQERKESRDIKQDTRKDAQKTKVDCRQENNKSNAECRQDKRDTKQDGRQQARDVKY